MFGNYFIPSHPRYVHQYCLHIVARYQKKKIYNTIFVRNGAIWITSLDYRDAVAQSVERATPGEEVLGLIPAVTARPLLVGLVSV